MESSPDSQPMDAKLSSRTIFKKAEKKDGIHGRHNDQKKPGTPISMGAAAP